MKFVQRWGQVLLIATAAFLSIQSTSTVESSQEHKMVVEIWSDVMCPFCYIGKRRFEQALREFEHGDNVEVVWRSFQLNPNAVTNPEVSVTEDLAQKKGWTLDYTKKMQEYVTKMAEGEGLSYDFDNAVVANSFNAHRLLQFAKTKGKGDELKEKLLSAYFTEGKNTDDQAILIEMGIGVGLTKEEVEKVVMDPQAFADKVNEDLELARNFGINAVPTFVFDRTSALSGAQDVRVFRKALKQAFEGVTEK